MVHILRNQDGTVNLDAVKKETDMLKAKYAQNAENARKNAARQEQQDKAAEAGTESSAPQQGHGDLVPPKAEAPQ